MPATPERTRCRVIRLTVPGGVLARPPRLPRTILFLHKADRRSVQQDGARVTKRVREILGPTVELGILLTSLRDVLKSL